MKILITGATGFVGSYLIPVLERQGHDLVILSRDSMRARAKLGTPHTYYDWNYVDGEPCSECFQGVDAIIHLMGEGIAEKRWSTKQKKIIHDSRALSSSHLASAANRHLKSPLKVFISASAVGFYDLNGDATVTEDTPRGNGFLAEVCGAWEDAARKLTATERHVIFRIGVVLGHGGGALAKMLLPFKMGVGGILGTGKQFMNWVHVQDLVGMIASSVADKKFSGVYNAVSPDNATNSEFTKTLGKVLNRPTILPAPAFALKMALGEMSELLLKGQNIKPKRLLDLGFEFKFGNLTQALEEACLVRDFPELKKKPAA